MDTKIPDILWHHQIGLQLSCMILVNLELLNVEQGQIRLIISKLLLPETHRVWAPIYIQKTTPL